MTMRVLRRRHRAKAGNRPAAPLSLTLRADVPVGSGTHALYPLRVAEDRQVDRGAWARVVSELMASETRGKVAPFAKLIEFDERTIRHWLAGTVGVREDSVRKVAAATGRNAMELLVKVGYYSRDEVGPPPGMSLDEELELVRTDPRLTDDQKLRVIDMIVDRRAASLAETRRMIDLLGGGEAGNG